ncbi:UDP-glucuronic acid decarboxylase 2-like [Dorcoceras hygrometricum]|uniref:UDP-glucuronic acid decarboxylase 2-like n=1 Tax=Dorcoceras hygrometricum TaxID=472368 RepID=A0A2Z7BM43_9LAMI|nr:UDP-glucuronic acid decarboxylase 2-like [Dorcoceras hygrometricum]
MRKLKVSGVRCLGPSSSSVFASTLNNTLTCTQSDLAPGFDYFSIENSTSLVVPNQVHDRFPIPLLECTRIPTNILRAEPPRQDDRSEVRRRRRRREEGEEERGGIF